MDSWPKSTVTTIMDPSSEVTTPAAATHDDDFKYGPLSATASTSSKVSGNKQQESELVKWPETTVKEVKSSAIWSEEDGQDSYLQSPRLRSSRLFRTMGKEALTVERERKKPLRLLDLPVDVLKDIVKEVTHTNDLTSLALCHSALHQLAIPHIYSRFDIVWPESSTQNEQRSGVDALTYGLATLVMGEEIFGEAPSQRRGNANRFKFSGHGVASDTTVRRRRGNHYAQFTKKFSLGNGPSDWVQEYLTTKESGKMLGTLVALAIARMRSLETFIWDMPTGILRDIWLALSSLGDREDGYPCRLEKVWVRWHNNASAESRGTITAPHHPNLPAMPPPLNTSGLSAPVSHSNHLHLLDQVEHPSFSVLPPLKSLSVLDIDEVAYLDEMAVLIGKSLDKLRELRVGIARHATTSDFVTVWEGEGLQQVDSDHPTAGSNTIGEKRLGGVLGTLTGFVQDIRKPRLATRDRSHRRQASTKSQTSNTQTGTISQPETMPANAAAALDSSLPASPQEHIPQLPSRDLDVSLGPMNSIESSQENAHDFGVSSGSDTAITNALTAITSQEPSIFVSPEELGESDEPCGEKAGNEEQRAECSASRDHHHSYLDNLLQLDSLELERVPLSVPVLEDAIDWTRLTSLTLLNCPNHEHFWKTLRRSFAPVPKRSSHPHLRLHRDFDYPLKLKKIHTNTVSSALVSFVKETLAPNSLETLFLQEARSYSSTVQLDAIYRGPLRRHRKSLKKLLIDSSERGSDGQPTTSSRWKKWLLTSEVLNFVCTGKMSSLRELGMAIDYGSWHYFLQHLPQIPHLRSLYIPFLGNHVHGVNVDAKELALQLVDIVALRPEVELCYIGIARQCFEILENKSDYDPRDDLASSTGAGLAHEGGEDEDDVAEDDEVDDDEGVNDTESDENDDDDIDDDHDDEYSDSDTDALSDASESSPDSALDGRNGFRQREILFYDDKVAIFKARHGRL